MHPIYIDIASVPAESLVQAEVVPTHKQQALQLHVTDVCHLRVDDHTRLLAIDPTSFHFRLGLNAACSRWVARLLPGHLALVQATPSVGRRLKDAPYRGPSILKRVAGGRSQRVAGGRSLEVRLFQSVAKHRLLPNSVCVEVVRLLLLTHRRHSGRGSGVQALMQALMQALRKRSP